MGEPSAKAVAAEWDHFRTRVEPMLSRLGQGISSPDVSAALHFSAAIACHLANGGGRDLGSVDRLGTSRRTFERGRISFSREFPADPFDAVEDLGLVELYHESPLSDGHAWQLIKTARRQGRAPPG